MVSIKSVILIACVSCMIFSSSVDALSWHHLFRHRTPSLAPALSSSSVSASPDGAPTLSTAPNESPDDTPRAGNNYEISVAAKAETKVRLFNTLLKICPVIVKPTLCVDSVHPYFDAASQKKIDPIMVLQYEIKTGIKEAQNAIDKLNKFAARQQLPRKVSRPLNVCKMTYMSALESFKEAEKAVPAKDIGWLNSVLSAVFSFTSTCDDTFVEFPSVRSPLDKDFPVQLRDLNRNCLSIMQKQIR